MASAVPTTSNSLKAFEWMWQSNPNPWSKSELATWNYYSDIDNLIIEEAFSKKQQRAILDDYYINFNNNIQVSVSDSYKQRPVKRVVRKREGKHLREERFMGLPVASDRSFGGQYGWVSPFVIEVRIDLGLQPDELPSKRPDLIPMLVEKAAQGFIQEGEHIGEQQQAEELASLLREKKNKGMEEVWKRCAYLYSMECFLYKVLNATMRLVGSKEDQQIWRSKVRTLGPFCLLLWDDPFNERVKMDIELYRGANLTPEQIAKYEEMDRKHIEYGSLQAFTSCSRNRKKAENFGNAVFIMQVKFAFIADLSEFSAIRDEEEELIMPGVCFRVLCIRFDDTKKQHLIYLEIKQRWESKDKHVIQTDSNRTLLTDAFYADKPRVRTDRASADPRKRPNDFFLGNTFFSNIANVLCHMKDHIFLGNTENGLARRYLFDRDYADRDYTDRDYADRDYTDRDYADRDYTDRDYADRDYTDRDYADRRQRLKDLFLRNADRDYTDRRQRLNDLFLGNTEDDLARHYVFDRDGQWVEKD
ncbi:unnamed protein product [Adineta steineri]|nr:unnamed protein product [Adineta steineri]CAF1136623.1 unnamed protein product [Adineta steineri]